jgi:hypothetical protein
VSSRRSQKQEIKLLIKQTLTRVIDQELWEINCVRASYVSGCNINT